MSLASVATDQNANLAAAASTAASSVASAGLQSAAASAGGSTAASGAAGGTAAATALNSLTSNFGDFLNLLMTELQHQDPSSPLDTAQFTTQLVQFAGVAQQITANQSLTQLIQLTQSGEIINSSSIVGKQVAVNSSQMPLQDGNAALQFTGTAGEPVAIAVYDANNQQVANATLTATAGTNTWTWNGEDGSGDQLPDGPYTVAVMTNGATGTPTAVPFTVVGTVTGVQSTSSGVTLQMGSESVAFTAVQSVLTGSDGSSNSSNSSTTGS
jgi:flagellar basal-body rod modification protein FlgD